MASVIRYRTGINDRTGKPLRGRAHLGQSLAHIWLTRTDSIPLLLSYGANLRSYLSEDITPSLALDIYSELIRAAHQWEPEIRIGGLQLVHLRSTGRLGLAYDGLYFPEGRFGNYAIQEAVDATYPFAATERPARAAA